VTHGQSPVTCAKKRFREVSTVLRVREEMGAVDTLNIYFCERCAALHLGGEWESRAYASWQAATQAAGDMHRVRGPLRVRINRKPNGCWSLRVAPAHAPRPARDGQAPPPMTTRMDLSRLRVVGGV
jgi:hypothetical protein